MTRICLHRVALAAAGALVLALSACDQRPTGAAGPAPTLRIAMRAAVTGNTNDALGRVENAHVKVTLNGALVADTTLPYTAGGLELAVRLPEPSGTVSVAIDLLYHGQVLFRGSGSAEVQRGTETRVPITITPVVVGVVGPDSLVFTALGDSTRLRGAAVLASGDTVLEAPLTWSSDSGATIRVGADGMVTALRDGQGRARVSYLTFSHVTGVRVQPTVAKVTVSPDSLSLFVDSTGTLAAVARDRNGNVLQRPISWSSSNAAVASVNNGVVRAVAPGTATITATAESQSATARIAVKQVPVASVQVTPASAELLIGGSVALTARTLDAKGNVLVGRPITWSSSNPAVATVDASGIVNALAVGAASVTATSERQSGSASIQVVQPLVAAWPGTLGFRGYPGTAPQTQTVSITNAGGGSLTGLATSVAWGSGASGWLSVSLSSSTAPATLTVTAAPGALPAGTYTATITVSSGVAGSGTAQVTVQMTLVPRPPMGAVIGVQQGTDLFIQMRTDTLGAQTGMTVNVLNVGSGTLSGLSASVNPGTGPTGWLNASLASGTAPTTLDIRAQGYVSVGVPGGWVGDIVLSSTTAGVNPLHVHVTYQ